MENEQVEQEDCHTPDQMLSLKMMNIHIDRNQGQKGGSDGLEELEKNEQHVRGACHHALEEEQGAMGSLWSLPPLPSSPSTSGGSTPSSPSTPPTKGRRKNSRKQASKSPCHTSLEEEKLGKKVVFVSEPKDRECLSYQVKQIILIKQSSLQSQQTPSSPTLKCLQYLRMPAQDQKPK